MYNDFQRCAPGLCTLFQSFIITTYWRVHGEFPGCTVSRGVHPAGAQTKSLILDTVYVFIYIILQALVYNSAQLQNKGFPSISASAFTMEAGMEAS